MIANPQENAEDTDYAFDPEVFVRESKEFKIFERETACKCFSPCAHTPTDQRILQ
jgi:hypothetical protein